MREVRIDEAAAAGAPGNSRIATPLSQLQARWTSSSKWVFVGWMRQSDSGVQQADDPDPKALIR